jgi:hypothetical protein
MSDAIATQGIKVNVGDGAEPTEGFTIIAEVTGFTGPTTEASEIEVTSLNSPAKEFIAGLVDNGEMSLEVNAVPSNTQHDQIRTDITDGTVRNYQIDFNDMPSGGSNPTTYTFAAFAKAFPFSAAADDKLSGTVTLRITGAVTVVLAA